MKEFSSVVNIVTLSILWKATWTKILIQNMLWAYVLSVIFVIIVQNQTNM